MNYYNKMVNNSEGLTNTTIVLESKIPRPLNAFMLYAKEYRKALAQEFPTESNIQISKRLGENWKLLQAHERAQYFDRAREIDLEHKKKYPNYVYNPIEARIRKAMREAKRDRLIGASPMLPRPSARRVSHGWVGAPEELRMSPMSSMRGGLESPVCFPISTGTGSNQFMSPMNSYNKLESTIPNHNTMHNGYNMQPNPLDQLQQQTEMWSNYPDGIRPRSSGSNSFMMQDVPYTQPQQPVLQSPLIMEQQQQQQLQTHSAVNSSNNSICMTPPHSNENVPPDEANEKVITTDTTASPATDTNSDTFETKHTLEIVQPLMENNNIQQQQHHQIIDTTTTTTNSSSAYIPLYDQQNVTGQQFVGKTDDMNMKKTSDPIKHACLPQFDLNLCASSKLYLSDWQYQKNYITKYLQNSKINYEFVNVVGEDGDIFPYVTHNVRNNDKISNFPYEIISHPNYLQTDVGYIPLLDISNTQSTDNVLDLTSKNDNVK